MEEGETGGAASNTPDRVAAANHLRKEGWWNLSSKERATLEPLLSAGLSIGVNLDIAALGLKPALVMAEASGGSDLWDVSGDDSFALRGYYSSSLCHMMLVLPPLDTESYRELWAAKEQVGLVRNVSVLRLENIRFLSAHVKSFNEERHSFDFSWDDLPRRVFEQKAPRRTRKTESAKAQTIVFLNELIRNPKVTSLGEISSVTGVDLRSCVDATRFVAEYPLGWGFHGAVDPTHSGLILLYRGLRQDVFGALRGALRNLPFTALEAWGSEGGDFTYLAEVVVPGQSLAETTEYIGRISSICGESFSYGFYEMLQLERYPLAQKLIRESSRNTSFGEHRL